jgi:hypothetical protein
MDERYQEILATLERAFPGQVFLKVKEFSKVSSVACGTIYNELSKAKHDGRVPMFPLVRLRGKWLVRVHDAARYLAGIV